MSVFGGNTVMGGHRRIERIRAPLPTVLGSMYTNFPATEAPISQSGRWTNGLATGGLWNNVNTSAPSGVTPGLVFGATTVSGTDDCIAHLTTSYHANQFAQGRVFKVAGYSPANPHEIELLLNFAITSSNARGYEVLWGIAGNLAIVRWNGAFGDFTSLFSQDVQIGAAVTGDVFRAEIVDGMITAYKNGVVVGAAYDTTWSSGQPGLGFWPKTGGTPASYCYSEYTAGEL